MTIETPPDGPEPRPSQPSKRAKRAKRAFAQTIGLLLCGLFWIAASDPAASVDPIAALNEGNRLFRDGRLEEAAEAYRAGFSPRAPHPTLVYNLGTTMHHLDRLPEAILWYRRAGDSQDAWLHDNLWLARRTLGSQSLPPGGIDGLLSRHGNMFSIAGIVLAWIAVALIAFRRAPRWPWILAVGLALGFYGIALAGERWASRSAVLLEDCRTEAGELPAGTEAWVRPGGNGQWRIAAEDAALCPPDAVALVSPRG